MALKAGSIRFNTDSSQMEIWDGNQWTGILATSPEEQTGVTRGVIAVGADNTCLLYTSPSPRDLSTSRMPSSA